MGVEGWRVGGGVDGVGGSGSAGLWMVAKWTTLKLWLKPLFVGICSPAHVPEDMDNLIDGGGYSTCPISVSSCSRGKPGC